MNTMTLIGTLTRDPEMREAQKTKVCDLRLVESGGRREAPLYVDVKAYGRQAEVCAQYLTRGRMLAVQGQLRSEEIDLENGCGKQMRYWLAAEHIDFLSTPKAGAK